MIVKPIFVLQHVIIWIVISVIVLLQINLPDVSDKLDLLLELFFFLCCISLLLEISRLKLGLLMWFGWTSFTIALGLDVYDEYAKSHGYERLFELLEETFRFGLIAICIAFFSAILTKRKLIKTLKTEIKTRRKLEQQLQVMAFFDPLTNIGIRRAFFNNFEHVISEMTNPYLICIDLDNFKRLNDTQGHNAGDEVLKHIASALDSYIAKQGNAYRFGGDEFVVIIDHQQPQKFIEQVENSLQDILQRAQVGLSCGYQAISTNTAPDQLIILADQEMYKQKVKKKNARAIERK